MIIAIFGPSGSGKTTVANKILEYYLKNTSIRAGKISQDNYYRDYSDLSREELMKLNFDDPATIDFDLLREHLIAAKQDKPFIIPYYDNKTASRSTIKKQIFYPKKLVIVEGHLLMSNAELCKLFDFVIYVDVEPDIALMRRVKREDELSGQVSRYTLRNYESKIAPMLRKHILPNKNKANCLLKNEEKLPSSQLDLLIACINLKLSIINFNNFCFFTPDSKATIVYDSNKELASKSLQY